MHQARQYIKPQKPGRTAVDEFKELRRETREHFEGVSRRLDTIDALTDGRRPSRFARQQAQPQR